MSIWDLLGIAAPPEWTRDALCTQVGGDGFFPEMREPDDDEPVRNVLTWAEAKRICDACDVRDECLTYALERNEQHGIWGGMTAQERKQMRKKAS